MTWLLSTRVGRAVTALLGALAAFMGVYVAGRRKGADKAESKAMKERIERQKDGRDAVIDEQQKTSGLSDSDVIDRMRRRSRDRGGM